MKATIAIDDELFAKAQKYAGDKEKSAVIKKALKAFVEREAARRLGPHRRHRAGLRTSSAQALSVILADTSIWIDHLRA